MVSIVKYLSESQAWERQLRQRNIRTPGARLLDVATDKVRKKMDYVANSNPGDKAQHVDDSGRRTQQEISGTARFASKLPGMRSFVAPNMAMSSLNRMAR